jgi:Holliday junction DNA helicase RuvA
VHAPLSTFYELPDVGQTVSLNIYTHVREDALLLFGFRTVAEKEMFLHLITVNGVGPRLAANILSGVSAEDLRRAVLSQDRGKLQGAPGVGKKIAERIILELKDKVKSKGEAEERPAVPRVCEDAYSDALSALLNLGYKSSEAEKALMKARMRVGDAPELGALLKEALRLMA